MSLIQHIEDILKGRFPNAQLELSDMTGTGDHLSVEIVSEEFEGLTLIKQHQIVMDCLKPAFADQLHAIKIKTIKPSQLK